MKRYQEKLEEIPDEKIVEIPSEIAVPILQRFQYVTNETLIKAFVSLLAAASSSDLTSTAHPVEILKKEKPDANLVVYVIK